MTDTKTLTDNEVMRLSEAIKKYDGEWIAFREQDDTDDPMGIVLIHNKDEDTFDDLVFEKKISNCTIKYCWDESDKEHPFHQKNYLLNSWRGTIEIYN